MKDRKNNVNTVKERLVAYGEREDDISNQQVRLDRIEMRLTSIRSSSPSDMPKSKGVSQDKEAELIAEKIDLENDIKRSQSEQKRERKSIEELLSHLKKSSEKAVIRMRYFDREDWSGVSCMLFGGKDDFLDKEESYLRRTYMIHGAALLNMAKYLEGCEK